MDHPSSKIRSRAAPLSNTLRLAAANLTAERVDIASIIALSGRSSMGAALLLLALPMALPVPLPGISILFGLPLVLLSGQLLLGWRRPWLPQRLAHRSFSREQFLAVVDRGLPVLRSLERFVYPRFTSLAGDWAAIPVGAICFILAIIITLPIPLGHMLPGTAVSLMGLGLVERDGLVISAGFLFAVIGLTVVYIASAAVISAASGWLTSAFTGM